MTETRPFQCGAHFTVGGVRKTCIRPAHEDDAEGHWVVDRSSTLLPVSDPAETLALIAEHRLAYWPWGKGWVAVVPFEMHSPREGEVRFRYEHMAEGRTIGDAVRACVARIKEGKR